MLRVTINPHDHLLLPLPLAELLHATLGPLCIALENESHAWAPLVRRVLGAYTDGRDDMMTVMYGPSILQDVAMVTVEVADELIKLVDEMSATERDFEKWSDELNG